MKKSIILILIVTSLLSCKQKYWIDRVRPQKLSTEEMKKFTLSNDTLYYSKEPVALYTSVEWEYYRGRKTLEISFDRIGGGLDGMSDIIVNYIYTKHPRAKAEVKIKRSQVE